MMIVRDQLSTIIPHSGAMCLLDGVLEWDESRIKCRSGTHRDSSNPLRSHDRLHAVCGIEYVSQAMAAHAALAHGKKGRPPKGYLASVRNFEMLVSRLDTIKDDLDIEAVKVIAEGRRALYDFRVSAQGRILMSGRAAVAFEAAPP
jgi:predicted hotdog family 3-hydroxylacyl-ACP dehydratase